MKKTNLFQASAMVVLFAASAACWGGKQEAVPPAQPTAGSLTAVQDKRSVRRRVLENDVDRLVAMATQLKAEVDKTNKNILSVQVVNKAEEIEVLAHRLKEQEKR